MPSEAKYDLQRPCGPPAAGVTWVGLEGKDAGDPVGTCPLAGGVGLEVLLEVLGRRGRSEPCLCWDLS